MNRKAKDRIPQQIKRSTHLVYRILTGLDQTQSADYRQRDRILSEINRMQINRADFIVPKEGNGGSVLQSTLSTPFNQSPKSSPDSIRFASRRSSRESH